MNDRIAKPLGEAAMLIGALFIHALAVCYIWLFLFVPIGAPALRLRDAFAVSLFINFIISATKLSNDTEKKIGYRFLTTTIHAVACVLLAMFYSITLL